MAKKVGNTYFFTGKGKSSGGGGGGGDATEAIKYTEQTLNESQQMQARKNQGLYYSEGGGEDVTLTWDGDTTGLESVDIGDGAVLYKVSNDAPQKELVKSIGMTVNGVEQIIDIPQQSIITIEGGYGLGDAYIIVATESEVSLESYTFTKGIWFVKGTAGNYVSKFIYGATETVHQIPAKYIPSVGSPAVKMTVSGVFLEFNNIGFAPLTPYTPTRDITFSVDGWTVTGLGVFSQDGNVAEVNTDSYTFGSPAGIFVVDVLCSKGEESKDFCAVVAVPSINP